MHGIETDPCKQDINNARNPHNHATFVTKSSWHGKELSKYFPLGFHGCFQIRTPCKQDLFTHTHSWLCPFQSGSLRELALSADMKIDEMRTLRNGFLGSILDKMGRIGT